MSRTAVPAGFDAVNAGRLELLVDRAARTWMEPVLRRVEDLAATYPTRPLPGGRGGTLLVTVAGNGVVVRPCRRGGLPARLLHDVYFGRQPRPFVELTVLDALRHRNVPVVDVYGAVVRWIGPCWYRGWLATRYVPDAQTLWQWAQGPVAPAERDEVLHALGVAVRRLHAAGGTHPDLNANNVLVAPAAPGPGLAVTFIDFDRAHATPDGQTTAGAEIDRLWRSVRKLDPQAQHLGGADFDVVRAAYTEAARCA